MSRWTAHVKRTRRENPGKALGEIAKLASRSYQGGQRQSRQRQSQRQRGQRQSQRQGGQRSRRQQRGGAVMESETDYGNNSATLAGEVGASGMAGGRRRRRRRSSRRQ